MNDNEDTWIQLAAATANVVRWLCKEEKPDGQANQQAGTDAEVEQQHEAERGKVGVK